MELKKIICAVALVFSTAAFCQGVPVYDHASVLTAIQQLLAWEKQYQQMYQQYMGQLQQIEQQAQQIKNMSGTRMLGTINNALTNPVLSPDFQQQLNQAKSKQALIDTTGQQLRSLIQASQVRSSQIQGLMGSINQTDDTKGIAELAARIQAEQVMAVNEGKEAQLLNQLHILEQEKRDETLKEESRKVLRRNRSAFE